MKRSVSIALAFVGLLVGAGFATGQEVIQYFVSFGINGIWGSVISGVIMAIAGGVILQLGSYFLADEHFMVFKNVSHPIVSRILDVFVVITLFALGFVMLAGAGSSLEQHFHFDAWIGSLIMLVLVLATGFLDVDKVSNIISAITPLVVLAVATAFIYTMINMPEQTGAYADGLSGYDPPVQPWWLSALNYNGLALLMGVSMCLVIGGNNSNLKAAWRGGLAGGSLYLVMMIALAVTLYLNLDQVADADVPMLQLFTEINPILGHIMVWIIFGMIYNTAIGMFYALARRVTASHPERFRLAYVVLTLIGFAISFVGFTTLMNYVYPVLGYMGMILVAILVAWWAKSRVRIRREAKRRKLVYTLTYNREHPDEEFTKADANKLEDITSDSVADDARLTETIQEEVYEDLEADPDVDFERPEESEDVGDDDQSQKSDQNNPVAN